jgi:F0F1-type ATP synthase assembly protein I
MTRTLATKPSAATSNLADDTNHSSIVIGLTISMAWQLAVVVLVPVFGGHLLDAHLHPNATPIYTLIGLLLAIVGMIVIVRQTLRELNKVMNTRLSKPGKPAKPEDRDV